MKICSQCNKEKEEEEFGWRNKEKGILLGICKECKRYNDREYYKNNSNRREKLSLSRKRNKDKTREYINNYKMEHGCAVCGEKRFYVLDLHHPNDDKEHDVSLMLGFSLNSIKEELDKCKVLCANCHRAEHYRLRTNNEEVIL